MEHVARTGDGGEHGRRDHGPGAQAEAQAAARSEGKSDRARGAADAQERIERALRSALDRADAPNAPPRLAAAMRYAVFPGGARVRPHLTIAVAEACGDANPQAANAVAAAIELLHCASLVHDDMPCFDDATLRRGRPTVHAKFDEPIALLAGDAMIVLAFETVALGAAAAPHSAAALIRIVAQAVGMPAGIVAGQGWEGEIGPDLTLYHRAKTGALFIGAACAGAVAAGAEPEPWRALGARLGEAYQVADDLADVVAEKSELAGDYGKPIGQDAALGRPNIAAELGVDGAVARLRRLIDEAVAAIPPCRGADRLRDLVLVQATRLAPKGVEAAATPAE